MKPGLGVNDTEMFYRYLKNTNVYFEYGSGGSTYQASILNNIKKIYSVESDIQWQHKLKQTVVNQNIMYIYNEMHTLPNTWPLYYQYTTNTPPTPPSLLGLHYYYNWLHSIAGSCSITIL